MDIKTISQCVLGECPGLLEYGSTRPIFDFFVNDCLRSYGQVVFANNPLSGLLAFVALLVDKSSRVPSFYALIGVLIVNFVARWIPSLEVFPRRIGIYGFNVVLIERGITWFLTDDHDNFTPDARFIIWVLILPLVSLGLQSAMNASLIKRYGVASLNMAFNIVVLMVLLEAERSVSRLTVTSDIKPSAVSTSHPDDSELTNFQTALLPALLKGVSQCYIDASEIAGCLILIGIAVYSRILLAAAVLGSCIGVAWVAFAGAKHSEVSAGVWGYNSVLTGLCLFSFLIPNVSSLLAVVTACLMSCMLVGVLGELLLPWGLPVLGFPFAIVGILTLVNADGFCGIPGVIRVPLERLSTPEKNRRAWINGEFTGGVKVPRALVNDSKDRLSGVDSIYMRMESEDSGI